MVTDTNRNGAVLAAHPVRYLLEHIRYQAGDWARPVLLGFPLQHPGQRVQQKAHLINRRSHQNHALVHRALL